MRKVLEARKYLHVNFTFRLKQENSLKLGFDCLTLEEPMSYSMQRAVEVIEQWNVEDSFKKFCKRYFHEVFNKKIIFEEIIAFVR